MEQEKIITLLYNFYNQGCDDGYEIGYNGINNDKKVCLCSFSYIEFKNWCEENWDKIVDFSETVYQDVGNVIHEFFKESLKKEK